MLKPVQIFTYGLLTSMFFAGCKDKKIANNIIVIRPEVLNNPIFKQFNKENESSNFWLDNRKTRKSRTSNVSYRTNYTPADTIIVPLTCDVSLGKSRLNIDLGSHGFFGGYGFDIICTDNKYRIVPYLTNDQAGIEKPKTTYQIIKQSLILNKAKYSIGDSIFGKVDFKIIENKRSDYNNGGIKVFGEQKITHIGKGYFRGEVEQSPNENSNP